MYKWLDSLEIEGEGKYFLLIFIKHVAWIYRF